jgi:hypothetical protein
MKPTAYVRIKNTYIILKKERMVDSCGTPEENIGSRLGNFRITQAEAYPGDISYRTKLYTVAIVS